MLIGDHDYEPDHNHDDDDDDDDEDGDGEDLAACLPAYFEAPDAYR